MILLLPGKNRCILLIFFYKTTNSILDTKLGAVDNYQLNQFKRMDGLNIVSFRRNIKNDDPTDIEFKREEKADIVWAIGKLNKFKEPRFHYIYPKVRLFIMLFVN